MIELKKFNKKEFSDKPLKNFKSFDEYLECTGMTGRKFREVS